MNPALVSIHAMRTMSNADLITAARKFDRLSILETELVKRLDAFVQEETRKDERTEKFLSRVNAQTSPEVRKIVDWAKQREAQHGGV